jgi:nitroreductase
MQFDEVVKKRKSVRAFNKLKKASWKAALDAVDAALRGPFAGNMNNLKFLIVENPITIKEISKHSNQHWITQSAILIVVCSDDTHLEKLYGERGRIYCRQQAGAAIATILLKLVDLGMSACWVGAYTDELVKTALNIPQNINVEAIIPIGYEAPSKIKHERRKQSLEHALYWEKWMIGSRPTGFEETLRELYKGE